MDDIALALDAAIDRHHARRQNDPPLLLKDGWPNDEIGDGALVLDGDEHDPVRRTRHLPYQHKSGSLRPSAIACRHGLATGDDAPWAQIRAQKGDGATAKGQPPTPGLLDPLAAGRRR